MREDAQGARTDLLDKVDIGGFVYGVLAVATVIAAESTRQETYGRLVSASVVTMVLYWLAHAYSQHWGSHLTRDGEWSLAEVASALAHEVPILVGAIVPIAVLGLSWVAGVDRRTGVTAVLWAAGAELVLLELLAGIWRHSSPRAIVTQVAMGLSMGLGILGLRVLLH